MPSPLPKAAPLGVPHLAAPRGVPQIAAPLGAPHLTTSTGAPPLTVPSGTPRLAAPRGAAPLETVVGQHVSTAQPTAASIIAQAARFAQSLPAPLSRLPALLAAFAFLLPVPALAQVPVVVTDIPPVHALVAQVMGDLGTPVLLLERGADEHDFQLRPSQMQSIADAGLIVWIGPELTPWLDRATLGATVPMLALLNAPGTLTQAFIAEVDPDHADEAAASTEDDGHSHDGTDPHVWLNPENAALWLPMIAADLARIDPDNAATYSANAAAAVQQIALLDGEIAATLAPIAAKPFVTYHNAYGYFATHYALAYEGALANGEAAEPGAAHLVALRAVLAEKSVRCVLPEAQHDPALAAQLIDGTPARMGGALDPVGSTLAPGADAYAALLRGIAATLVSCLQG